MRAVAGRGIRCEHTSPLQGRTVRHHPSGPTRNAPTSACRRTGGQQCRYRHQPEAPAGPARAHIQGLSWLTVWTRAWHCAATDQDFGLLQVIDCLGRGNRVERASLHQGRAVRQCNISTRLERPGLSLPGGGAVDNVETDASRTPRRRSSRAHVHRWSRLTAWERSWPAGLPPSYGFAPPPCEPSMVPGGGTGAARPSRHRVRSVHRRRIRVDPERSGLGLPAYGWPAAPGRAPTVRRAGSRFAPISTGGRG